MVLAFGIVGSSEAVTTFRASEASHEKAARINTAANRFGTKARTSLTMVLTVVSFTASAAMRTTMRRKYHFTTPAITPAGSV